MNQHTPPGPPAHPWSVTAVCLAVGGLVVALGPPITAMLGAGVAASAVVLGGISHARRHDGRGVALVAVIFGAVGVLVALMSFAGVEFLS